MRLTRLNAYEYNNKTGRPIPGAVGGYLYFRGMTRAKNDSKIAPVTEIFSEKSVARKSGLKIL